MPYCTLAAASYAPSPGMFCLLQLKRRGRGLTGPTVFLPNRSCCSLGYTDQRTSSMDHSAATSAADIFSSSQEIPLILFNLNVHYCNHKSPLTTCARCTLRYRGLVSADVAEWWRWWAAQGRPVERTLVRASVAFTAGNGNASDHI